MLDIKKDARNVHPKEILLRNNLLHNERKDYLRRL